jgi:hypothetical protein
MKNFFNFGTKQSYTNLLTINDSISNNNNDDDNNNTLEDGLLTDRNTQTNKNIQKNNIFNDIIDVNSTNNTTTNFTSNSTISPFYANTNNNKKKSQYIEDISADLKQQIIDKKCVSIRGLRKVFKNAAGGDDRVAVHGLDLDLFMNQVTVLLGFITITFIIIIIIIIITTFFVIILIIVFKFI